MSDIETQADDVRKVTSVGESLTMSYFVTKPSRWTFEDDKIRKWLYRHLSGRVLNACAGKTHLDHSGEIVRNDLNTDREVDTHHDVREIGDEFSQSSFDTIIYDPPFNQNQADDKYNGIHVADAEGNSTAKREFHRLLKPGGRVIQFGYTTTNMPGELGYSREAVAIFNTLGNQYDILGTVDRRLNGDIENYE
jgi:hypothetical protein